MSARPPVDEARARRLLREVPAAGVFIWPPYLMGVVFLAVGLVPLSLEGAEAAPLVPVFRWIALGVFAFAFFFNWLWNRTMRRSAGVHAKSALVRVMREGTLHSARVLRTGTNEAIRRGNIHMPLYVILMEVSGAQDPSEPASFGYFAASSTQMPSGDIEVLYHPQHPRLAIPYELVAP